MRFSFGLATRKRERKRERKRSRTVVVKPECKISIPENVLIMEILPRLPAKSLMRFKCVSRLWYSLICSRLLSNLFLKSGQGRRAMFMSLVDKDWEYNYALVSSSSDSAPVISPYDSNPIYDLNKYLGMPGIEGSFVSASRGLVCFRIGTRVRICNLTTKQHVTLPILRLTSIAEPNYNVWNFFGHDLVHDEYKVLSIVWEVSKEERIVRSEHQVLVLGPEASWRNTKSTNIPPPHRPYSQGISINNILYYGAWIDEFKCVIMSFDMRSEEFTLIELPLEAGRIFWDTNYTNIMNYKGKIALFEYGNMWSNGSIDVWVLEDAGKSEWLSKKNFVLPSSQTVSVSMPQYEFSIQATSHSCEIRLAPKRVSPRLPHSAIYDLEKNKITKHIQVMSLHDRLGMLPILETNFWDDIESIMYLET